MSSFPHVPILEVWRALGGPEPQRGRAPAFWRNGDNPQSVTLSNEKGCWYDHRDNEGGGVIDLVQRARGCNRAVALTWLEGEGFLEPRTLTREQRTEHARRRDKASSAALDIARWRDALTLELNARKLAALEVWDEEALACAASLCRMLENGPSEAIVRKFIRQRANDPSDVARLIVASQERDLDAQRITAEVVLLLARVATGDSRDAA